MQRKERKERCDKGVKRILPPKVSKPRSEETAWRHKEDGTYDNRPISETYHK